MKTAGTKRLESADDIMNFVDSSLSRIVRESMFGMMDEDDAPQPSNPSPNPTSADGDVAAQQPANQQPVAGDGDDQHPTVDMIVTKINSIRSGRSLRDSAAKTAMEQYFDKLNDTERIALYSFLKGLATVVTGEVSGTTASDPSSSPNPGIKMTKTGDDTAKHVKNVTIIKTPHRESEGLEDTSAPLPIRPRQR